MPSGECSEFACPEGFYRDAEFEECKPCHISCLSCKGLLENECTVCPVGFYLSVKDQNLLGICEAKIDK